jgi:ATP-dependent Clp protease protease subunit
MVSLRDRRLWLLVPALLMTMALPRALAQDGESKGDDAAASPEPEKKPNPDKAKEDELKRLRLAADLRQQELEAQLADLKAEKARLDAQMALSNARQGAEAEPDKSRLEAMRRAADLRDASLKSELASVSDELERLKKMQALAAAKLDAELAAGQAEVTRLKLAQDLADAQHRARLADLKREQEMLALENAVATEKRKAEQSRMADEQLRAEIEARTTAARIQGREGEDKYRDFVNGAVSYTDTPFQDGVLTVSDRKIELDGPIVTGTADWVCDRIDYFNNQDRTKPIFIVINNSPGGSVMQGYRILKAVETSDAPVHVVVKSFAASMAATIATLAPHSYAYPNAIILHHQMSGGAIGNMTDIEQEVKTMQEWERRLAEPIARKMGITLPEFKARMYEAKRSGDWDEFADKAVELKWIDHIVNEIREEGIRKKPTGRQEPAWLFLMQRDEQGKPYMRLPPLEPYDCYFMVNPRGIYRVDGR